MEPVPPFPLYQGDKHTEKRARPTLPPAAAPAQDETVQHHVHFGCALRLKSWHTIYNYPARLRAALQGALVGPGSLHQAPDEDEPSDEDEAEMQRLQPGTVEALQHSLELLHKVHQAWSEKGRRGAAGRNENEGPVMAARDVDGEVSRDDTYKAVKRALGQVDELLAGAL
jgi:hypothetical protein